MIRTAAIAALVLLVASCGGDDSDENAGVTTTLEPSETTVATASTPAFIDIETCDNIGGEGEATGTIENQGSTATGYRYEIGFFDDTSNEQLASGTAEIPPVEPGTTGEWTVSVSGLGDASVTCKTVSLVAASEPSDDTTDTTDTAAATTEEFPCDLVSQSEASDLAGNPLDPGDVATNHVSEDSATWTAHECAWPALGAVDPTEVTLTVSLAADFPSGSVECPPIAGSSEPAPGVGNAAQWAYTDAGTEVTVGELRVCADEALVGVRVSGAIPSDEQLTVARGVAEAALAAL